MTVYMMVTDDKFELPLAVADSAPELAAMIGRNVNTIYSGISHEQHGRIKRSIYKKVEIKGCKKRKSNDEIEDLWGSDTCNNCPLNDL